MPAPHTLGGRVAASTRIRALVAGRGRQGGVLGVFASAVYVEFAAGANSDLVAIETADGLRLPCAATLAAHSDARPLAAVRAGDDAWVGDCRLEIGPLAFDVVRWWSPQRPRSVRSAYDDSRLTAVTRLLPALPTELEDRLSALTRALETGESCDIHGAAVALLGLGAGLTPQGDDLIAGLLVALAARQAAPGEVLADVVRSDAPSRTTSISAALLREAADGFAVPALVALIDALHEVSDSGKRTTQPALEQVVVRLLAVGHTSGAALAHGAVAAARLHAAKLARSEVA
jgi:hypothetical protein